MPSRTLPFVLLFALASGTAAAPVLMTKDNYKSAGDSPFDLAGGGYYLEDFETGTISAVGLHIDGDWPPEWGSKLAGPADSASSIEPGGWSLRSEYAATRLDGFDFAQSFIEFDPAALGGLPTGVRVHASSTVARLY